MNCLNSRILLTTLFKRNIFLELSGVGGVVLLAIIAYTKQEKTGIKVVQDFKGEISFLTTLKPNIHCQPQDPRVGYESSRYRLVVLSENKCFNSCVAPWLLGYKGFLEGSNNGSKHYSSLNYLFLSDSITNIVLNCHKTPQRTK